MDFVRRHQGLAVALVVAGALGLGSLILQRWVAETRGAAILMVIAWYGVVALGGLILLRDTPQLRRAALLTVVAITAGTVAVGYWTGFRDREVDEDVIVASAEASETERAAALSGDGAGAAVKPVRDTQPAGPVNLATGPFTGVDGHGGSGTASVVRSPDGSRTLTFTDFDVDPGPQVLVYLTRDESGPGDDPIDLGTLKGNVGDQQYEIPASADLGEFDTVVLWCVPFTTRIAVAPLR